MKSQKFGFFLLFAVVLGYLFLQQFTRKQEIKNIPEQVNHIVAFGDNLTLGNLEEPSTSYPKIFEKIVGITVENKGFANETTETALDRLRQDTNGFKGEVVIITLGAWDLIGKLPLQDTLKNLAEIFQIFLQKGYMVAYGGFSIPPTGDNWLMAISQLCVEYGVLYLGDLTPKEWSHDKDGGFTYTPLDVDSNEEIAKAIKEKISGYL